MTLSGTYMQVLVGGYELTASHQKVAPKDMVNVFEVTALGDPVHNFLPGKRSIGLQHTGYMNPASNNTHPIFKGANFSGIVSLLLGQNAVPAFGDPVFSFSVLQGAYQADPQLGKHVGFAANLANVGANGGWGALLAAQATFSGASANGSSHDNGASNANGGAAFLHILQAAATDRFTIILEHSTTGAFGGEQTTLATFTLNASAVGAERIAISGTINRYTRWKATRTSGSAGDVVKIAANLVRL